MRDGVSTQFVRRLARGRQLQKEGDAINRMVIDTCGEKSLVSRRKTLYSTIVSDVQGGNVNLAVQNENSGRITSNVKKNKEAGSSSKLSIGFRILHAFSRMEDGKTSNIIKEDGVLARRKRKLADVFENIEYDNAKAIDEFVSVKLDKEANNGEREVKWKRVKPRIIDLNSQDNALPKVHGVKLDASDDMHSTRPLIKLKEGDELFVHLQGLSIHDDL